MILWGRPRRWKGKEWSIMVGMTTAFLVAFSCRTLTSDNLSFSNVADMQAALGIEPGEPFVVTGPDLPPVGRSVFDQVTATAVNGRWEQDVPFPLSTLLAKIDAKTTGIHLGTLIPRGRSLQRNAALPHPFQFPRAVFAFVEGPKPQEPLLRDRLYLGYVESARQLEVISFNEAAGRYEFQIVKNYGPGLKPQVSYAPRFLCMSCHQNQAPIFSNNPWAETNGGSVPVSAEILKAHPGADHYLDLPIAASPKSFEQVASIDASVERANLLGIINRLWIDGCGREAVEGSLCRAKIMELALNFVVGICNSDRPFDARFCSISWHDPSLATEVEAEIRRHWYHFWPTGMKIPSPKISSRNIEKEIAGGPDTAVQPEFSATLLREPMSILKPSKQMNTANLERLVKGIMFFMLSRTSDRQQILDWANQDPQRLRSTLRDMAERARTHPSLALGPQPFNRQEFLKELREALGVAKSEQAPELAFWPAVVTDELASPAEVQKQKYHPMLQDFVDHCGRCHLRAVPWLGGEDGKPSWEKVSVVADRIIFRLNWETHKLPGEGMPPSNSLEYRYLKDHPEIRAQMLKVVETCRGQDLNSCTRAQLKRP